MGLDDLLLLLGGLGSFLFGMKYMGDGLEASAGPKMSALMEKLTRTPIRGFLLGMLVTVAIQSSSATTVMVMGFINAGILTLAQGTGVIIGANIGTTITSVLIALDISAIAPFCIFAGAVAMLYCKKNLHKHIGQVVLGFGLLFQGLHTMSGAMGGLKDVPAFQSFITTAKNPVVGLLVGVVLCAVIQSSSAAVGVLQALASQGLMPLHFASFLICGINIGSSVPPFLSAINAENNAKRAACVYFIYNVVGAIIFVPITIFTPFTQTIESITSVPMVQVSLCHIIFKVVTAVVLLPFTNTIVKLSYIFVPKKVHEDERRLLYIDKNLATSPNVMAAQVQKEVERMGQIARANFVRAAEGLLKNDVSQASFIRDQEDLIDYLKHSITEFLVQATRQELPAPVSLYVSRIFHVVSDIERIGDHSLNLLERTEMFVDRGLLYSAKAIDEIEAIYETDLYLFDRSIGAFRRQSLTDSEEGQLHDLEETVDMLVLQSQDNHVVRLRQHQCSTESGLVFDEVLNDLERIGDHSFNIAQAAKSGKPVRAI